MNKLAEKFSKMALALGPHIEDKRRPMTQNMTPKRNREYRSRLHDADNMERTHKALLVLAKAHDENVVPAILGDLRTKDEIGSLVRKGIKGGGYYDVIPDPEYADKSLRGRALQALIECETAEQTEARVKREKAQEIERLIEGVRFCDIPGFFPTPTTLADEMVRRADIRAGNTVLEPSAGKGDLADAVLARHPHAKVSVVERWVSLQNILRAKGYLLVGEDFMETNGALYDRIIMNPPFERHAFGLLRPGGKLVAIASEGLFSRTGRKEIEFREWLESVGGESEKFDGGAFNGKDAFRRTGIAGRIVEIIKPWL